MDETTIREKLREFIATRLIREDDYHLTDKYPIISSGLINSFSLAEIGLFIESEFGIYIPDADLTVEAMDTLDQIVARVIRDI